MSQSLPTVGQSAPPFRLPASDGQTIDLSALTSRSRVVLYFYPKADTPGCTKQACGFRDTAGEYKKAGVVVLGVSPDPIKNVIKFAEKFHLNFPLLADADHAVCEQYGVWQEKSMYGKKYMGVARTTFVIAKGGKIEHVFEKVKPEGHEAVVMEYLQGRSVDQAKPAKQAAEKKAPAAKPKALAKTETGKKTKAR